LDDAFDFTDEGGGKWKDRVCGMTREQMRSEKRIQGSCSHLGLRSMFQRPPTVVGGAPEAAPLPAALSSRIGRQRTD
jgi:hypothetical protein